MSACQERVSATWQDQESWTRKSILTVAHMGWFSSDRTIREYAAEIWGRHRPLSGLRLRSRKGGLGVLPGQEQEIWPILEVHRVELQPLASPDEALALECRYHGRRRHPAAIVGTAHESEYLTMAHIQYDSFLA